MTYKISRDGQEYGPYTLEELQQYVAEGSILATDYAFNGLEWVTYQLLQDPQRGLRQRTPFPVPLTLFPVLEVTPLK